MKRTAIHPTRLLQRGACVVALFCAGMGRSAEPLHERVDRMIESSFVGPVLSVAGDADFVRRVHLDLIGRIPSADEARAFFADVSPDKRAKLVDRLLASPGHARQMATVFDVMLMERRPEKSVKAAEWQQWLFNSFATNKPYNELAREILAADGSDEKLRVASRFYLDRDAEQNLLARDTGRIFFGKDLACAQCHDHPRIDDYFQRDYHGLYAFFNRAYLFTEDKSKKNLLAEKSDGEVAFTSVFTKEAGATRPRLPGGEQLTEPRFRMGDEWIVRPDAKDKNLRPLPKFSRVAQLARAATDGSNRAFNRNIANRLWALMMGRGLVEPVDEMHSDNPPTYPALLDLLADEFVAMRFDTRALLRELALTRAYQRSFDISSPPIAPPKLPAARVAELEAEQKRLADAVAQDDEALKKALADITAAKKAAEPIFAEFTKTNTALAEVKKSCDPAITAHYDAQKLLTTRRAALQSVNEALAKINDALNNLPSDKDLTNSAATLKSRSETLTKDVDAAAKDAETKSVAAKPMFEKLAAMDEAADPIRQRHDEAERKVIAMENELSNVRNRREADKTALHHVEKQLADAKTLLDSAPLFAEASASRVTVEQLRSRLSGAKRVVVRHDELAAAQKACESADVQVRDSKRHLAGAAAAKKGCTPAPPEELTKLRQVVAAGEAASRIARLRLAQARRGFEPVAKQFVSASRELPQVEEQLRAAEQKASADCRKLSGPFAKLSPLLETRFASGALVALTPEQLAWSMMRAAGVVGAHETAGSAEFDKKSPPPESNANDPARLAERAKFIEQFVWDKLKSGADGFVPMFANAAGQPQDAFYATADQALFFNNGSMVRSWLAPSGGNLVERLMKAADARALADELYLSVLTRPPTVDEVKEVEKRLTARANEKQAIVQELTWALLTSVEFRFKH